MDPEHSLKLGLGISDEDRYSSDGEYNGMVAADPSLSLDGRSEQELSNQVIPLNLLPTPQAGTSKNIKKNGKSIKLVVKKNSSNADRFSTIKTQ